MWRLRVCQARWHQQHHGLPWDGTACPRCSRHWTRPRRTPLYLAKWLRWRLSDRHKQYRRALAAIEAREKARAR